MDKIYSISEIIEASNNILNISKKNLKTRNIVIKKNKILEETSSEVEKKILNDSYTENVNVKKNYEIDEETKKETLDKIYKFLKKKIRRNTLKIIFEQENEIETLKKKNNHLNESKIILKTSNTSIFYNLVKINQNNKNLNQENSSKEKILKKVNDNLNKKEDKIKELKSLNHNYNNKILKLEEANSNLTSKEGKLTELINKLKFYQEENLRLSNELFNSNKKNDTVKKQLIELGLQKNQIQSQIQELNNLVSKSNLVAPSFAYEHELPSEFKEGVQPKEDIKQKNKEKITNLDKTINKIFNKQ
tara:strand:+ start:652 stop:1563 length:912 start_codon:yes stop_codon:yes gene_type:complete